VDGEHEPGEPKDVKEIKKYLFSSKTSSFPTRGATFFIDE
jgi:hypothetical protein